MSIRGARALIASLSALLALGCAALAVAHAGVELPLLSRLGPTGDGAVVQAVRAFAVAAVVFALLAAGAARGKPWAWALGTFVHAVTVVGSVMQYRGVASLAAIAISAGSLVLLLSRPGRSALLPS